MKILIVSDSHGDVETMCGAVDAEQPDVVIHLGDHIADADRLNERYPGMRVYKVPGNTDSGSADEEWIRRIELCGKSILLTHGHTFLEDKTVKTYFEGITKLFLSCCGSADIILFGHTHEPFINCCNGKWIMNPGHIGRRLGQQINATYGILEIVSDIIQWRFQEAR